METVEPGAVGQNEDIDAFVASINEKLTKAGTGNAELAFGMGCGISIIPIGILLLVLYILGLRGWVGFGLVVLIGVLLSTTISTSLASRARTSAIRQTYARDIEPQILQYLREHKLEQDGFQEAAVQVLPSDAPLLKYIAAENQPAAMREE
jgi:hypothetical protein